MSEQAPNVHQKIAGQIKAAADTLPSAAVSTTQPVEGMDITRIGGNSGYVQLAKTETEPDMVVGGVKTEGSTQDQATVTGYGFRSEGTADGQGAVETAGLIRSVPARDANSSPTIYEHRFSPANKDKAAELITRLAIKQAARDAAPPEAERKAA